MSVPASARDGLLRRPPPTPTTSPGGSSRTAAESASSHAAEQRRELVARQPIRRAVPSGRFEEDERGSS
jgi:hypothetical protein